MTITTSTTPTEGDLVVFRFPVTGGEHGARVERIVDTEFDSGDVHRHYVVRVVGLADPLHGDRYSIESEWLVGTPSTVRHLDGLVTFEGAK